MRSDSIQGSLLKRLAAGVGILWLLASFATLVVVWKELEQSYQYRSMHLARSVLALYVELEPAGDQAVNNLVPDQVHKKDDYFVLIRRAGVTLFRSRNIGSDLPSPLPVSGYFTEKDVQWEFVTVTSAAHGIEVLVGLEENEPRVTTLQIVTLVGALFFFFGVAGVFLSVRAVRKSFFDINQLNQKISTRNADMLDPLADDQLPKEIRPLVVEINSLMERLRRSMTSERALIRNAAHELRTPITAIRVQAEAIDATRLDSSTTHHLNGIVQGLDRAGHLVSRLVALFQAGSDYRNVEAIDITALCQNLVVRLEGLSRNRRIDVSLNINVSSAIKADQSDLESVLTNLLENALKFSPEDSNVSVSCSQAENQFILVVEDSGPGLSNDEFTQACNAFERLGAPSGTGAGLGLSIVAEVCQSNSWEITADRSPKLGGLRVIVRLVPPD